MAWNPSPTIGGASWTGNPQLATKNQLLSTSAGLYEDLKDFNFSTISVSTLTVPIWISTPLLNVSSIIGGGVQLNDGTLVISTGDFSLVSLSTVSFKGIDLGGVNFSFDLGLGNAIGGFLGGLGGLIGGAFIGIGTGTGLAIQGITNGLFSLANTRGDSLTNINTNVFETVNGTAQLQISTLGYAFPLYSSIFRSVSSLSANEIPGPEIFLSTFFQPGTTCVRTVSDPITPLTANSTINTSTIQSFGQWVPFIDPTPTGEDIFGRTATFSTLTLNSDNYIDGPAIQITTSNLVNPVIVADTTNFPTSNDLPIPFTFYPQSNLWYLQSPLLYNQATFPTTNSYISTPYTQFQSTLTSQPATYFITSSISTPAFFTWAGTGIGNFAICQPDETGFRSTATFDFKALSNDLLIQWGLAVDNRNSTIGVGTGKRVTWDNSANTSNFIDIPVPQSTIVSQNLPNTFQLIQTPYETRLETSVPGPQGNGLYLQATTMRMSGGMGTTSTSNYGGYNYQFDGNTYVNGILEAQTIIALSSIVAVSTNLQTFFSTQTFEADFANILKATISSATISNLTSPSAVLQSSILISTGISNAYVNNLRANNLTVNNLVYSNAEAPNIQTSTISFGYNSNGAYSLQMNVSGPTVYSSYVSASNQIINFANLSNSVIVNATQISTPYNFYLANFGPSNIQGWASTIFYNPFSTTIITSFTANTPPGTVSLQGGPNSNSIWLCSLPQSPIVTVAARSTFQFFSDGTNWTTTFNPPSTTGTIAFNNTAKMFMDYENFTISTSDTLVLSADILQVNAQTNIPSLQANNIYTSNLVVNPVTLPGPPGGIETNFNKPINRPFAALPTTLTPLQMTFTEQSPDGVPQYNFVPPFMGSNQFTSYNVSSWNNTLWNNNVAFSLGAPAIYVGDVQTTLGPYSGSFYINNTINTSPSYALPVYQISTTGAILLTSIPGGNYGQISTTNGTVWTTNTNAANPLTKGGNFSNIVTVSQTISQTTIDNTQNLAITAPNAAIQAGTMYMNVDQIRVNSRTYGDRASAGLPSFPIGIENNVYIDNSIFYSLSNNLWESIAVNALSNINGTIFYDANSWIVQIIPSRFRCAEAIYGWDVQPTILPISGGPGFCWGYNRFIQVNSIGTPGPGTNWNWYIAIPKNYCTYL